MVIDAVPEAKIDWHCNGEMLKSSPKYEITDDSNMGVLSIHDVQSGDAGTIIMSASNECGQITFEVPINVKGMFPAIHRVINPKCRNIKLLPCEFKKAALLIFDYDHFPILKTVWK